MRLAKIEKDQIENILYSVSQTGREVKDWFLEIFPTGTVFITIRFTDPLMSDKVIEVKKTE